MSGDRCGESLRSPLLPSPLKLSPRIPLYLKGILRSAVFLSATSEKKQTPQKSQTLKQTAGKTRQRFLPVGEAP